MVKVYEELPGNNSGKQQFQSVVLFWICLLWSCMCLYSIFLCCLIAATVAVQQIVSFKLSEASIKGNRVLLPGVQCLKFGCTLFSMRSFTARPCWHNPLSFHHHYIYAIWHSVVPRVHAHKVEWVRRWMNEWMRRQGKLQRESSIEVCGHSCG